MQYLIVLVCLSFLFARSVQAESLLLAIVEPPFRQVQVVHGVVAPGQEQTLFIALDQPDGNVTTLQLAVSYPSGATQDVFSQTSSSDTSISWVVPADAGVGAAQVRLITNDCGCGLRVRPASPVNNESSAEGTFFVQQ